MGIGTKKLGQLLSLVDSSQLKLPEIQREFVWTKKNIKLLFDSLYRELPIGQMLVWIEQKKAIAVKSFHGMKPGLDVTQMENFYGYLLDGQQRLTAIALVRDRHPDYPLMASLWPDDNGETGIFFWQHALTEQNAWVLPVADILDPGFSVQARIEKIKAEDSLAAKKAEYVNTVLTSLKKMLAYDISVIEYISSSFADATELFIRFNYTGKRLKKSDLVVADLANQVPGLISSKMRPLTSKWKGYRFTLPFLTQCLTVVHTDRITVQEPKDVFANSGEVVSAWEKTTQGLAAVMKFLTGTVRWDADNWLPSFNALIPLIYIRAHDKEWTESQMLLARRWLLLATARRYFSGSVYSELDKLLRKLEAKPTMANLWNITPKRILKALKPEDFDTAHRNGAVMSLYVSMLRNNNARDWKSHTMPLDGTVIGDNAKLHVHHFFPKALLTQHDKDSNQINTLANLTILSAETNYDMGTQEPATYHQKEEVRQTDLETQCIPLDRSLWRVARYEDFLYERRRLLALKANQFIEAK